MAVLLAVSAAVGAALYAETPAPKAPAPATGGASVPAAPKFAYPRPAPEMEALAKRDPLEFLRVALKWHDDKVVDYTCQFLKVENIGGELRKPETMQMKWRSTPFSVYLKWVVDPSKDQEAIYADGANGGKAVVHPSGLLGILFRKVNIDPLSKTALKYSRRPVTMAGMGNMLRLVIPQCELAKSRGDLQLTYEGLRPHDGRPCYVFKRVLPDKKNYPCEVLIIYVEQERMVCVRTDAYDWSGELVSHYAYTDVVINPGLSDGDFDPDNRDYAFRLF